MEPLILASSSPRRRELLTSCGFPFEIDAPDVDEACSLPPCEAVAELSLRKAKAAALLHPGRYILAADTLVALEETALGKPKNTEDAFRMLCFLCGKTHQVFTGVTVIAPGGQVFTDVDRSDITFGTPTEAEIRAYVATGEPMDKAGAYALQGGAAKWISRVEGSPSGTIGLPMFLVRKLLLLAGYVLD